MQVKITDQHTIDLIPETQLEASVVSGHSWGIKTIAPEPLEPHTDKLRLVGKVRDESPDAKEAT